MTLMYHITRKRKKQGFYEILLPVVPESTRTRAAYQPERGSNASTR